MENSHSSFRELRLEAELGILQLARELNADRNAVSRWDRSECKPRWGHVPGLARFFGLDTADAIRLIWKEKLRDPCACGCGGTKVQPTKPGATRLYVELPCRRCGTTNDRVFSNMQRHADELCRACSRKVERTTLWCVGYYIYREHRWANNCSGRNGKKFLPWEIAKSKRRADDHSQPHFIDIQKRAYRCGRCAGAVRMFHATKEDTKKLLKQEGKPVGRIRSVEQLTELHDRYAPITATDKRRGPDLKARHRIPPKSVQGLCRICEMIIFAYLSKARQESRPARFHQACLLNHQREHGNALPAEKRGKGHQRDLETLQKHFEWAYRYKVKGESVPNIAKRFDVKKQAVSKQAVWKAIRFIVSRLPPLELVPERFQQIITIMRS